MLLIHYYYAYISERRKHAHSGAYYYWRAATPDALPLIISFPRRKLAMHHRNFVLSESAGKTLYHLTCK